LNEYLRRHTETFDLIVSADTLVYFGDLKPVLAAAADALRPGGFFIFTLEHAVQGEARAGYRLELHGRYSHTREYVERAILAAGLQPSLVTADLRMESGTPVAGLVVRAAKSHDVL
jgi:predicted TPR repeat methyltransferase